MNQVLLVSIGYRPNIGGIETHFADLVKGLYKRNREIKVLTYMPLTTSVSAPFYENSSGEQIVRLPIIRGFFYILVKNPILEFIYLTPGLFFALPILVLTKFKTVRVIHSHGLVAGFVSVFWGRIFKKRVI